MTSKLDTVDRDWLYEKLGFVPTERQAEIIDESRKYRRIQIVGGERGGKSLTAEKILIDHYPQDVFKANQPRSGEPYHDDWRTVLYWFVGEDYDAVTDEFEYAAADFQALLGGPPEFSASKKVNAPGIIEYTIKGEPRPRLRIEVKSAMHPEKIRRGSPFGILGCEASLIDLSTAERMRGRLAPEQAWEVISGTFEKRINQWFKRQAKAWQAPGRDRRSFTLPSPSNTYVYPGGIYDPEIVALKADSSDEFFLERIMGEEVPPMGTVFSEFTPDIHVREVNYIEGVPVHLWEDPGFGSHSAHSVLLVQVVDSQVRIFGEIYEQGLIQSDIVEMVRTSKYWKDVRYLVSDPYYMDAHHSQESVSDVWKREVKMTAMGFRTKVEERIERIKSFLKVDALSGEPRIIISPSAHGFLSEVGMEVSPITGLDQSYRYTVSKDGELIGKTPIDEYNHSIDALGNGLMQTFGYSTKARENKTKTWNHLRRDKHPVAKAHARIRKGKVLVNR